MRFDAGLFSANSIVSKMFMNIQLDTNFDIILNPKNEMPTIPFALDQL